MQIKKSPPSPRATLTGLLYNVHMGPENIKNVGAGPPKDVFIVLGLFRVAREKYFSNLLPMCVF